MSYNCSQGNCSITCDENKSYGCICWSMPNNPDDCGCECISKKRIFGEGLTKRKIDIKCNVSIHVGGGITISELCQVLSSLIGIELRIEQSIAENKPINIDTDSVNVLTLLENMGIKH